MVHKVPFFLTEKFNVIMSVIYEQVWQDFLKIIREEVGSRVVETWIKAVTFSHYDSLKKELYVLTPNLFVKNWVESHYKDLFYKHLKRLFGVDNLSIHFLLASNQTVSVSSIELSKVIPAIEEPSKKKKNELAKKFTNTANSSKLNPAYTFETFVVGDNNQFAYASALAVTDKMGSLYNPLLLYGASGLGKTHLLHAIGNAILEKNANSVVLYQTTDRFVTEFIHAIRFDSVAKFQAKYKEVDILLVDDIQFMVNKEQTQEVFFHIFNNLYESNKQIILTCDVMPRYLGGLADRLKSRLEWGLIADVQVPSRETKVAILKRKAFMQKEVISDEVANFIAGHEISSVRELEGGLIRVLAYASLTNQVVNIELVKKVLGSTYDSKPMTGQVDFTMIIHQIKKHFSYSLQDLRSKDRSKGVSHVRQITMYLMKRLTDKSLREIGEYLERKDHTTVTHALQRITALRTHDEKFAILLKNIEDSIV